MLCECVLTPPPPAGTPGVLLDMFFAHAHNNFLHAHVLTMVQNALANRAYHAQYAAHVSPFKSKYFIANFTNFYIPSNVLCAHLCT